MCVHRTDRFKKKKTSSNNQSKWHIIINKQTCHNLRKTFFFFLQICLHKFHMHTHTHTYKCILQNYQTHTQTHAQNIIQCLCVTHSHFSDQVRKVTSQDHNELVDVLKSKPPGHWCKGTMKSSSPADKPTQAASSSNKGHAGSPGKSSHASSPSAFDNITLRKNLRQRISDLWWGDGWGGKVTRQKPRLVRK